MYDQGVPARPQQPVRENPQHVHSPHNGRGRDGIPFSYLVLAAAHVLTILLCVADVVVGVWWAYNGYVLLAASSVPGLVIVAALAIVFGRAKNQDV